MDQFNVGSGKPWSEQDAVKALLDRFYDLSQRLTHISVSVEHLKNSFSHLAELSGRLSNSLMLLVGLPRVVRSDLYHTVAGSHGSGGSGAAGSGKGWDPDKALADTVSWHKKKNDALLKLDEEFYRNKVQKRNQIFQEQKAKSENAKDQGKKFAEATLNPSTAPSAADVLAALEPPAPAAAPTPATPSPQRRRLNVGGLLGAGVGGLAGFGIGGSYGLLASKVNPKVGAFGALVGGNAGATLGASVGNAVGRSLHAAFAGVGGGVAWAGKAGMDFLKWDKFHKALEAATYGFMGLSAAASSLVKAASPDAYATLTGSVQLLAGTVGSSLIPMFLDLSKWLQDAAFAYEKSSGRFKDNVAGLIKFGLEVTGVIVVARGLALAFSTLASKTGLLTLALGAFIEGGLNYRNAVKRDKEHADKLEQARSTPGTQEEAKADPFLRKMNELLAPYGGKPPTPESRDAKKLAVEMTEQQLNTQKYTRGKLQETFDQFASDQAGGKKYEVMGPLQKLANMTGLQDLAAYLTGKKGEQITFDEGKSFLQDAILKKTREVKVTGDYLDALKGNKKLPYKPLTDAEKSNTAKELLLSMQSLRVSPRYQAVEEAYKNVQIEALNKDPLELTLEQMVTNNLFKIMDYQSKQLGLGEEANRYLKAMSGRGG